MTTRFHRFGLAAAVGLLAGALRGAATEGSAPVFLFSVTGAIDPVVKDHLAEGLDRAARAGAAAAVIRLDTPGGLLDATRDIVQSILNAPFPVIVHVAPPGARAASAGLFITLAADVAAMAPETHLGAAHPVALGGGPRGQPDSPSPSEEKSVSDTAAYARALAAARGRNPAWAERAVRESLSLTSGEALKAGVIDLLAEDETALWTGLHGRTVTKHGKSFTLDLASAPQVPVPWSAVQRLLHTLSHPNVAYLLLMLGFYALVYELASPGIGLGGITGVVCLVLAFFSLQVLPLNLAGLALVIAGLVMVAVDLLVASHGLLILGGLIAFAIGSFMLFDRADPAWRLSVELILAAVGTTAAYAGVALRKALQARRQPPRTGAEALLGRTAEVRAGGMVFLDGALWTAEGLGGRRPGDTVRVTGVRGTRVTVEPISETESIDKREDRA